MGDQAESCVWASPTRLGAQGGWWMEYLKVDSAKQEVLGPILVSTFVIGSLPVATGLLACAYSV